MQSTLYYGLVLMKDAASRQIAGLVQTMNTSRVISMQYVDDTLLFLERNINSSNLNLF
jgi:hypothetical protein